MSYASDLDQIIAKYSDSIKKLDAFHAPEFNLEDDLSKFGDYASPDYFIRSKKIVTDAAHDLKQIKLSTLSEKDQRTLKLFSEDIGSSVEALNFPQEVLDFNQTSNRLQSFLDESNPALTDFPFDSVKHYEDFVSRADGLAAYVDWEIELHKKGLRKKIIQSCDVANVVPQSYRAALESDPKKNPFYRPVTVFPKHILSADQSRITKAYVTMITDRILPAYRKFNDFYLSEYQPKCRKQFGLFGLPRAREWYAHKIEASTSLRLKSEDVHKLGLDQVQKIESQIQKIQENLGNKQSIPQFLKSLNEDPLNRFKSSKDMLTKFLEIKARIARVFPNYFSIPQLTDFQIVEASNSEAPIGVYNEPTDFIPYGRFIVNKNSLLINEAATLLAHETSPGHHTQLALIYQMKDRLSEYQRKLFYCAAFTEGWGLYSEYLGREMGIYQTPLEQLGNLSFEMFRAVRLVVDTGIHFYGWSQKKVIEYMAQHLSLDEATRRIEANRYSVWPAQALSYKIGEIKIRELRARAEKVLGSKFDVREFHNAVIGSGNVSLRVLTEQVEKFILDRQPLKQ